MPVLRTRATGGGILHGSNLRSRNTGSVETTHLPETLWSAHVEGWHFDEAANTTRAGIRGRDFADVNSSVGQSTGASAKIGNAAYIQDLTRELRCTTNDFRIGGDFTVSFWIQNTDTFNYVNQPIMRLEDGAGNADWDLYANSNASPYMRIWDSVAGSATLTIALTWTLGPYRFVVLTYDSTSLRMEATVNADVLNQRQTAALSNGLRQGSTRLRLGDDSGAAADLYWRIDEMHIFREKKSDDWIVEMYNGGNGRAYPD